MSESLPSWKDCWRKGFAPLLPTAGLEALRTALVQDDPRWIQGATTSPPPLQACQSWPVEAADAIALTGWLGDGLETVQEVEEYFARLSFHCDEAMGEPAACRHLYNWHDDSPRDEVRRELLIEVQRELAHRLEDVGLLNAKPA